MPVDNASGFVAFAAPSPTAAAAAAVWARAESYRVVPRVISGVSLCGDRTQQNYTHKYTHTHIHTQWHTALAPALTTTIKPYTRVSILLLATSCTPPSSSPYSPLPTAIPPVPAPSSPSFLILILIS